MTAQQITSLATLHAVPDGEPVTLNAVYNFQFVYFDGSVWEADFIALELIRITDRKVMDVSEFWESGHLFQRVRLVNANMHTNPEGGIQQ